ncbi:unnamed protein product [Trichobilharzia regenti]|nr:unnamed protein product [Trichobilharzia regenti]
MSGDVSQWIERLLRIVQSTNAYYTSLSSQKQATSWHSSHAPTYAFHVPFIVLDGIQSSVFQLLSCLIQFSDCSSADILAVHNCLISSVNVESLLFTDYSLTALLDLIFTILKVKYASTSTSAIPSSLLVYFDSHSKLHHFKLCCKSDSRRTDTPSQKIFQVLCDLSSMKSLQKAVCELALSDLELATNSQKDIDSSVSSSTCNLETLSLFSLSLLSKLMRNMSYELRNELLGRIFEIVRVNCLKNWSVVPTRLRIVILTFLNNPSLLTTFQTVNIMDMLTSFLSIRNISNMEGCILLNLIDYLFSESIVCSDDKLTLLAHLIVLSKRTLVSQAALDSSYYSSTALLSSTSLGYADCNNSPAAMITSFPSLPAIAGILGILTRGAPYTQKSESSRLRILKNPNDWIRRLSHLISPLPSDCKRDLSLLQCTSFMQPVLWHTAWAMVDYKLKVAPWANPLKTFFSLEGTLRAFLRSKDTIDSCNGNSNSIAPFYVASSKALAYQTTNRQLSQIQLLMSFLGYLERIIFNATSGFATVLPRPSTTAALFFTANENTCTQWFNRIRNLLILISSDLPLVSRAGVGPAIEVLSTTVYHSYSLLRIVSSYKSPNDRDVWLNTLRQYGGSSDIIVHLSKSLHKLGAWEELEALAQWLDDLFTPQQNPFSWLHGVSFLTRGYWDQGILQLTGYLDSNLSKSKVLASENFVTSETSEISIHAASAVYVTDVLLQSYLLEGNYDAAVKLRSRVKPYFKGKLLKEDFSLKLTSTRLDCMNKLSKWTSSKDVSDNRDPSEMFSSDMLSKLSRVDALQFYYCLAKTLWLSCSGTEENEKDGKIKAIAMLVSALKLTFQKVDCNMLKTATQCNLEAEMVVCLSKWLESPSGPDDVPWTERICRDLTSSNMSEQKSQGLLAIASDLDMFSRFSDVSSPSGLPGVTKSVRPTTTYPLSASTWPNRLIMMATHLNANGSSASVWLAMANWCYARGCKKIDEFQSAARTYIKDLSGMSPSHPAVPVLLKLVQSTEYPLLTMLTEKLCISSQENTNNDEKSDSSIPALISALATFLATEVCNEDEMEVSKHHNTLNIHLHQFSPHCPDDQLDGQVR